MHKYKIVLLASCLMSLGGCKKEKVEVEEPKEVLTFWMLKNSNSQASVKIRGFDKTWTELENGQLEIKQVVNVGDEIELKHRYSAVFYKVISSKFSEDFNLLVKQSDRFYKYEGNSTYLIRVLN